jgi:hypothetical protein
MTFNTLVCGNLLLTGRHGFYFDESLVSKGEAFHLVAEGMECVRQAFEQNGVPISVYLSKDYEEKYHASANTLLEYSFNEFTIQPNMVLNLSENWNDFKDYLNAFHSKYRVRARRAFKKAALIQRRELNEEDIAINMSTINGLYNQVVKNVGFNVVKLHQEYFLGLKKSLGDLFCLTGYYLGDQLIGFYTTIENGRELEAHFLGIDQSLNQDYQIYLNMLYDMVRQGIDLQKKRIVFARTALEIKSSIGAVPEEMYCYLRHRNPLSNKFTPTIFEYLRPKTEWVQRHPFKT